MRPGDRTIRDELRREAAKVSIPEDMWKNISQQLDQDAARKARRRRILGLGEQWRTGVILAVAAGFFWFALIPALPSMENMPVTNTNQNAIIIPAGKPEPTPVPTRPAVKDNDPGAPNKTTTRGEQSTVAPGHWLTLPQ